VKDRQYQVADDGAPEEVVPPEEPEVLEAREVAARLIGEGELHRVRGRVDEEKREVREQRRGEDPPGRAHVRTPRA